MTILGSSVDSVASGSVPPSERDAYFRQRLALFCGAWFGVLGLGIATRAAVILLTEQPSELLRWTFLWPLSSLIPLSILWAFSSSGTLRRRRLHAVEMLCLFAHAAMLALMSPALVADLVRSDFASSRTTGPGALITRCYADLIAVFVLSGALTLRAAIVPTNTLQAARTAMVVALASTGACFAHDDKNSPEQLAATAIGGATFWMLSASVIIALAHIIHGLRRDVASARRLGQYTLERKLGEGGMGVVYRARHSMLRRPTAIKLLPPERVGERMLARFEREVQLTACLTHPNTVTIFDYGRTPDGIFYYAMELLKGLALDEVVRRSGPMPPARVVHVALGVCGALAEAHSLGLVHRDIKPANIVLARQGGQPDVPKILDFGLVKDLTVGHSDRTGDNVITGTPAYMAPEMISQPDAVDASADLYAFGALLFFLLTGEEIFQGSNVVEVCSHHLHTQPDRPSDRGVHVPLELETIIAQCLQKAPEHRPSSAKELERCLHRLDIELWTDEEAEDWWARYGGPTDVSRAKALSSGVPSRLEIDWRSRSAHRHRPIRKLAATDELPQ